jgi:hypothetical protein
MGFEERKEFMGLVAFRSILKDYLATDPLVVK